jgi:hypothetical protein
VGAAAREVGGAAAGKGTMGRVYRSKIDWFVSVASVGLVLAIGLGVKAALANPGSGAGLVLAFVAPLSLGLMIWTVFGTFYTLDDARLKVRGGPFCWQIELEEIRSVTPTRSPLSSPALSMDRLRIDYGQGRSLMVSPRDREAFVRDLLKRRDAALLRTPSR